LTHGTTPARRPRDALLFALAAYATARRAEIRHLRVEDVDLKLGVRDLGVDDRAARLSGRAASARASASGAGPSLLRPWGCSHTTGPTTRGPRCLPPGGSSRGKLRKSGGSGLELAVLLDRGRKLAYAGVDLIPFGLQEIVHGTTFGFEGIATASPQNDTCR
jgi:hypothetical protein